MGFLALKLKLPAYMTKQGQKAESLEQLRLQRKKGKGDSTQFSLLKFISQISHTE